MSRDIQEAIRALIKRKAEIDVLPTGRFVETHHWLIDAVDLLLRLQVEDADAPRPQV